MTTRHEFISRHPKIQHGARVYGSVFPRNPIHFVNNKTGAFISFVIPEKQSHTQPGPAQDKKLCGHYSSGIEIISLDGYTPARPRKSECRRGQAQSCKNDTKTKQHIAQHVFSSSTPYSEKEWTNSHMFSLDSKIAKSTSNHLSFFCYKRL